MKYQKSHLKSGDFVSIQCGDNRKKIGKILSINKKKYKALVVFREDSSKTIFIHLSNLFLFDILSSNFSRIGYQKVQNKKQRYFKKQKNIKA
jgi:ribosomal protein L24